MVINMCGILGYVGYRSSVPVLLKGLRQIEHRGHDAKGMAVFQGGTLMRKELLDKSDIAEGFWDIMQTDAFIGIGYSRWTRRETDFRARELSLFRFSDRIAVVVSGLIENYLPLREKIEALGYCFRSDTDVEVVTWMIENHYRITADLEQATRRAVRELEGSFAMLVVGEYEPDKLIAVNQGRGLITSHGVDEFIVASDSEMITEFTRKIVRSRHNTIAVIRQDGMILKTLDGIIVSREAGECMKTSEGIFTRRGTVE